MIRLASEPVATPGLGYTATESTRPGCPVSALARASVTKSAGAWLVVESAIPVTRRVTTVPCACAEPAIDR